MNMTEAGTEERAGRREWLGLIVVAMPTLLMSLDVSVLYLALPQLSADLNANSTQQLWIMDIYSFMSAGFLVTMGTLGDRVGRRRLLLIGAAGFSVASVLAAYSVNVYMLIASRALLGIAAATLTPSTLSLLSNMFKNPRQRGAAIGVWYSCFMGGMTVGPLIGGVLLDNFWWGSVFLLGVPVMVALLIAAPLVLPEYRDQGGGRLDLVSVVLSLAAVLPVIYGLKETARTGWHSVPVVCVVFGLLVGWAFVRRQRRLDEPLLDMRLFGKRAFTAAQGIMLLMGIMMAGSTLLSALYLQVVQGLSPLQAGLWLLPQNVTMVIGSMLAPHIARRFRREYVIAFGLMLTAVGFLLITQVDAVGGLGLLVTGLVCTSGGVSVPMPLMTDLVVGAAPLEKAGSAASIMQTGGEFGVALGVATLGSLGTLVYRSELPHDVPPDVPAASLHTALQSISAAAEEAGRLPAAVGGDLFAAAREAFTSGLNTVGIIGAGAFLAMAIIAVTMFRQRTRPAAVEPAVAVDLEFRS
ncbi:MFS transporter [Planotetraspora phitsanulokensis]|uniref:MFS transporter n=1 Tax=Planotetraspora phitsanulokensis TaxID=575192 RepID=A0A8J3UDG2_9ACTN|nr:MFS transporter [Planotetraspora phitsanulokensis]GII42760.1 MFS transporter [Planotetraspora phitsanulokensis]